MMLLDTHVFIWLVNGDEKLSEKYIKIIKEEQNKHLSVISCWEICLLLEKERIKLKYSFDDWIQKALPAYNEKLLISIWILYLLITNSLIFTTILPIS